MYLEDDQHASRWVKPKHQHINDDGSVVVLPQAFEMRDNDRGKLSVNWLEYFKSTHQDNIEKSVHAFRKHMGKIAKSSIFANGNVGNLKAVCDELGHKKVEVDHNVESDAPNPAHCSILRLPENDATVMQKLAGEVFTEIVLNSAIPEE